MFFKKYANLYRFKPYFMRQRRLLAVLLCCMLTGSSLGVVLSYLSNRQLISPKKNCSVSQLQLKVLLPIPSAVPSVRPAL